MEGEHLPLTGRHRQALRRPACGHDETMQEHEPSVRQDGPVPLVIGARGAFVGRASKQRRWKAPKAARSGARCASRRDRP